MNQGTFTIKVSDILLHSGSNDIVSFLNIFSSKIPGLEKTGITGNIRLKNLNKSEILVTLEDLSACFHAICDRCGTDFTQERLLDNISIQAKILSTPLLTEDVLVIDPKDLTITLEDYLKDQFLLHEPLKNLCTTCEQLPLEDEYEELDIQTGIIRH